MQTGYYHKKATVFRNRLSTEKIVANHKQTNYLLICDTTIVSLLAKSRRSKTFINKSTKQAKKSVRGRAGKKRGQNRKMPAAGRGRLGGGGPAPHDSSKPTPTATPEPEELTPGSPEETSLRETGSTFKTDELEQ